VCVCEQFKEVQGGVIDSNELISELNHSIELNLTEMQIAFKDIGFTTSLFPTPS